MGVLIYRGYIARVNMCHKKLCRGNGKWKSKISVSMPHYYTQRPSSQELGTGDLGNSTCSRGSGVGI